MKHFILLTKKGMKSLRKSLSRLERERKKTVQVLRESNKENVRDSYMKADLQAKINAIDTRMYELKQTMKNTKLITHRQGDTVSLGSVVKLRDATGRTLSYQIVSSLEADPQKGRISEASPLGRTLLGRKINDIIAYTFGRRNDTFQLTAIQ